MRSTLSRALIPALTVALLAFTGSVPASAFDSSGAAVTAPQYPDGGVPAGVTRLSGPDRFATSVAVSQAYAPHIPVVYVASGTNFPDALSAAPAAAAQGAPLLLTSPSVLPTVVREEIVRLAPALIVVVGGEAAVSAEVYAALAPLGAAIRRDAGQDRFETSRAVNRAAFPAGSTGTAFIATGNNFPDALSASAAAGSAGVPVILLDGASGVLDSDTSELVRYLGVTKARIAGGPAAVSAGIEDSLDAVLGASSVIRLAGDDRFATSSAVNRGSFPNAPVVYFAVGTGFADALTGAALAGREKAPLYVVPGDCVPPQVATDLTALGTTSRVLLGGISALGAGVEALTTCEAEQAPVVAPAGFNQPFDSRVPVTSPFGMRVHPITGQRTIHYGTDYSQSGISGKPIRALSAGKVVYRSVSYATTGAGNAVTISYPGGIRSVAMHMKDPSPLAVGDSVEAGDVIGYVGSTGGSTGPNLHLEVRVDGTAVDPVVFLRESPLAAAG